MSKTERGSIVAWLRGNGEYIRGVWYSWDMEERGYANSFADRIERGDHRTNLAKPLTPNKEGTHD